MADDIQQPTDWGARLAAIASADGDEWDRLSDAFDADWKAAYCVEFRRFAAERGWSKDDIESGWLDNLPDEAMVCYEPGADPVECARRDVPQCEREAANA
jgi:hypothetical protein